MKRLILLITFVLFLFPYFTAGQTSEQSREFSNIDLASLSWRSVGPANMGGRVSAIEFVPGSRTRFYIGYGTGGAFKTDNLGTTFSPIFDKEKVASIGSIAVADAPAGWPGWKEEKPEEGKKLETDRGKGKIVWIGTGEGNNRNSSSWGNGVYRSTDGGSTFTHMGLSETHDIPRMAVDPTNPDVLYVAALGHLWGNNPERGIFKTMDGGKSWQQILKVDDQTGACDVLLDPKNHNTVYAALYSRQRTPWSYAGVSEKGGIFRSDDGGKNWKKLAGGLPSRTGRIGLAIFVKNPKILYAVVESDFGGAPSSIFDNRSRNGGLFRTDDRGETWTRQSDLNFRPFYFSRVAIDPENDQRVYMPGWDFTISDDGGKTFRPSSHSVHVDMHAIVVNPVEPDQILIGNDGGLYISHDKGKSWDYKNNVAAGEFYRVTLDNSDPYRIAGGLQDNGSWLGPSETIYVTEDPSKDGILNEDWKMVFGSDGFTVAFDPTDPNVVYATAQGGELARVRLDNNVKKALKPAEREGEPRLRFNWNAPFLVSQHDPTVLYHGGNRVYRLTQKGDYWFAISDDLTKKEAEKITTVGSDAETYGTVVALAESPVQKGILWAGTDDGLIHVTLDEGKSWSNVTPEVAGGRYISAIATSWKSAQTAYAAIDGHRSDLFHPLILMTEDAGKSWQEITGDLPDGNTTKSILEDRNNPDVLYAGTEFAIYVTLNRGKNWVKLNGTSLPTVAVDWIVQHPRESDLVVATHGRSIWILDDASMFAQLTQDVRNQPLAALNILPATPRLFTMRNYGIGDGIFRAKNPTLGAYVNYWIRDYTGEPVNISIANASGFNVRSLSGTNQAGLNRVVWDLQSDPKNRFDFPEEGNLGQTQFVPAGDYKVTITMGKLKEERTVKVLPAANAK